MNLKNGKVFTSKFVGTEPSSYKKRIYWAAVSQRLRNIVLDCCLVVGLTTASLQTATQRIFQNFAETVIPYSYYCCHREDYNQQKILFLRLITQPLQEKVKQSTLIFGVIRCAALHSCTSAINTIQCEPEALMGWMIRGVVCYLVTDDSGQPNSPTFDRSAVPKNRQLTSAYAASHTADRRPRLHRGGSLQSCELQSH